MTQLTADRTSNRTAVMRCLLVEGSLSRAHIAGRLGLSKVAVTGIVNQLVGQGWLIEVGKTGGLTGRPASLVDLHPGAGSVLGLDIQPHLLRACTGDLRGERRVSWAQPGDPVSLNHTLLSVLEAARHEAPHGPLRQVVIALPAPIGPDGRPDFPSALPEFDADTVLQWSERHQVPVQLENDINLMALAEHRAGVAGGADSFCLLAERASGVGLGLILAGRLYRGPRGRAGELALVQVGGPDGITTLEALAGPERNTWLAQTVAAHSVSLDLSAIVVHQHALPEAPDLKAQLRAFAQADMAVIGSLYGEDGALRGALLHACSVAQERLLRGGFAPEEVNSSLLNRRQLS